VSVSADYGITWSTPHTISDVGQESSSPQAVVGPNGLVICVWQALRMVRMSRSVDGGMTWSSPISLSDTERGGGWPSLSLSGQEVTIAWTTAWNTVQSVRFEESSLRIESVSSNDGGLTWTPPQAISAKNDRSWSSKVVTDGSGRACVVWARHRAGARISARSNPVTVQSSRTVDSGNSWTIPEDIAFVGEESILIDLVRGLGGTIAAVWEYDDAIHSTVSVNFGVSWSTSVRLPGNSTDWDGSPPKIIAAPDGSFAVLWEDASEDGVVINAAFIRPNARDHDGVKGPSH
jgi:hypothetical protein